MTRSYFSYYVTEWSGLIELCREHNCDICDGIIDKDGLDDYIDSDIDNTGYGWQIIRDFLADIHTGYDYYRCDGAFDYVGLDYSDFEDYKARVLNWMDDNDLWEPEDEEVGEDFDPDYDFFSSSENEAKPEEPDEPPVEEEDFTVSELMCVCSAELATIRQAKEQRNTKSEDDMSPVLPF